MYYRRILLTDVLHQAIYSGHQCQWWTFWIPNNVTNCKFVAPACCTNLSTINIRPTAFCCCSCLKLLNILLLVHWNELQINLRSSLQNRCVSKTLLLNSLFTLLHFIVTWAAPQVLNRVAYAYFLSLPSPSFPSPSLPSHPILPPFPSPPFPSRVERSQSHLPLPSLSPSPGVPPLNQLGGLGERYKLPQWGLGRSPSRQTIWCISGPKGAALVATVFVHFIRINEIFCDFEAEGSIKFS